MLWHSIVQELWKRSPKMTSKEQQQTSSALLKKSHQGTQKANPLCLNKSVIMFCLSVLSTPVDSCDLECFALFLLSLLSFVWILSSFMIIICSDLIKILNYQSYTHGKKKHVSCSNFIKIQLLSGLSWPCSKMRYWMCSMMITYLWQMMKLLLEQNQTII